MPVDRWAGGGGGAEDLDSAGMRSVCSNKRCLEIIKCGEGGDEAEVGLAVTFCSSETNDRGCVTQILHHHRHHHHHVHEGLDVFPVPQSSRCSWSLHRFLGRPMFLRLFGLYCSACFGNLFVSILCMCRSHFFWYCFISFAVFCAPVFPLIH